MTHSQGPRPSRRPFAATAAVAVLALLGFALPAYAQEPVTTTPVADTTVAPPATVVTPPAPVDTTPATAPVTPPVTPPTTADSGPSMPALDPPLHKVAPSTPHPDKKPKPITKTTLTAPAPSVDLATLVPGRFPTTRHHHHHSTAATTGSVTPAPFTAPATAISSLLLSSFRIPPFLLPIYQAAGIQYGIHWQVLAAINEIESDYGRNLSVSSAGALGWMQFEPGTWATYGVDANGDGKRDPYNPVDAIFSAARYLKAAGGDKYVRRSIYAYNHAGWYVNSVLLRARLISALPDSLVSSLTGLTQGRPPVANTSYEVKLLSPKIGVNVQAPPGAAAVAVQDGRVTNIGYSRRLGHFVQLVDVYGNTYTYGHLGAIARVYAVPKKQSVTKGHVARELHLSTLDAKSNLYLRAVHHSARISSDAVLNVKVAAPVTKAPPVPLAADRVRSSATTSTATTPATPTTPASPASATTTPASVSTTENVAQPTVLPSPTPTVAVKKTAAISSQPPVALAADRGDVVSATPPIPLLGSSPDDVDIVNALPGDGPIDSPIMLGYDAKDRHAGAKLLGLKASQVQFKRLREGVTVVGGTVLGRLGTRSLRFEVRPAGSKEPRIDPAALISGWRQLQRTEILSPSATGRLASLGSESSTVGQVLLMTKRELMARVLVDPRVTIYACGRRDIETGQIDRRVLATLEYLADSNLNPTVSALKCGHSILTDSGNVSEHSTGDGVDIAAINGIPIYQHQGVGTITDTTIRRLLQLQGVMKPHQIISLMNFPGSDNTLALPDHYDHIHIGFRPTPGTVIPGGSVATTIGDATPSQLTASQWRRLMRRLAQIGNPSVPTAASPYALPDD